MHQFDLTMQQLYQDFAVDSIANTTTLFFNNTICNGAMPYQKSVFCFNYCYIETAPALLNASILRRENKYRRNILPTVEPPLICFCLLQRITLYFQCACKTYFVNVSWCYQIPNTNNQISGLSIVFICSSIFSNTSNKVTTR